MGYLHIDNLYKNTEIMLFRECFALEKIHGTSAHVAWKDGIIRFFSGGSNHDSFVSLFDAEGLRSKFLELGHDNVVVYGEAYGGKVQRMRETYGSSLRFIAFDVKVGDCWLTVPNAHDVAVRMDIDFVHYEKVSTDLESLNAQRDADSIQAIRNGIGPGKMREGVILRPLIEVTRNDGKRIIVKHKRDEFKETRTPREIDPEKLKILEKAEAIAEEWVTDERLRHVLDKLPQGIGLEGTGQVIKAMKEDVLREAQGEIVDSKDARKAIGRRTSLLFKKFIKSSIE